MNDTNVFIRKMHPPAGADRAVLRAEIERLRAENKRLRAHLSTTRRRARQIGAGRRRLRAAVLMLIRRRIGVFGHLAARERPAS